MDLQALNFQISISILAVKAWEACRQATSTINYLIGNTELYTLVAWAAIHF